MNKWISVVLQAIKGFIDGIAEAVHKYGRGAVFCGVFVVILTLFLLMCMEKWLKREVDQYVGEYKTENVVAHRQSFADSRDFYLGLKTYMKQQRNIIGCDYMFLIEFHNGNENAITNIQFCKFDITVEVQDQSLPYAHTDDIINENIFKYDLLLSDRITDNKIDIFSCKEMMNIDHRFYNMIAGYNDSISRIVTVRMDYYDYTMGMLVMLFNSDSVPMTEIINCSEHIEKMITSNADIEHAKFEK